ncbi:acyl-CoA dehydrogenase [Rhodohalobacter sp. SW132]|uniref:acyl-CoA dehydrogenase family protein n=1 Tax=Rhodohalobacter sp. SW132 TaxID=2293433 RepID=UPI000E269A41|nr:acyl-CoA dehydrogenase family protein [Rhodohalobacter sp. SW132]REL29132.1 acyl-CoA dehydrogenase [Rhodohalobacter sp. SW132]
MNTHVSLEETLRIVRKIASDELTPRAEEIDKTGKWPEKSIRALQQAGLGGIAIPSELGGHGQGLTGVAKVCEILGHECASTAMCFGMHLVGSAVLAAKATPHQKEHYIAPIVKGEHLTTLSISEPGTGSHFYIPEAELKNEKNGKYTLNGTKSFVTNGSYADSYVVSAVIPAPDTAVGQFTCVVVDNRSEGLNWKGKWEGIGMKGNSSRTVEINNLRLSENNILGEKGDQIWYVFEVVAPYFLTAMAGTYLGIAASALEEATNHLNNRSHTHTGTALSHQPVLQHRLGAIWAKVESARQLLYSAAEKGDTGSPDALLSVLSSKAVVSDCVVEVVNEVMTLMGGKAYASEGKLSRHLRDARASHVMAPTTDLLKTWMGRALLDVPLLGD